MLSWTALKWTFIHKVDHSSGLERATRKVETCGPASILVELEQTLYTVSYLLNFVQTDVKISCVYSPMFCMEIDPRARNS